MAKCNNDFNQTVLAYYKDLKKCKPISRVKERSLLKKAKNGDLDARNTIVEANLRFVFDVARKYKGMGIPVGDLISDGNMGLIKAIDKFDMSKDVKFISYAVWWIKQAIFEDLDKRSIAAEREISVDEETREEDTNLMYDDDVTVKEYEVSIDEEDNSSFIYSESMLKDAMDCLNPRERVIIERYFGINGHKGETTREIGEDFGITGERIRKIKLRAMRKMRAAVMMSSEFFDE